MPAKESEFSRSRISKVIKDLLEKATRLDGSLRDYEEVESEFNREVGCPIVFSQNKYACCICIDASICTLLFPDLIFSPRTRGGSRTRS